FSRGIYW
nr:immunoglobulin heavy chain junction region [Macaca mulatta]MOX06015.1 immunoglobulin heavy chain junction region [Macaca mulatta]